MCSGMGKEVLLLTSPPEIGVSNSGYLYKWLQNKRYSDKVSNIYQNVICYKWLEKDNGGK